MKLKELMDCFALAITKDPKLANKEVIIIPEKGGIGYDDIDHVGHLDKRRGLYLKAKMGNVDKF